MPKIKSFTPSWLSQPSPGHSLFAASSEDLRSSVFSPYGSKKKSKPGPRRTIARRGTEVFVAVGREVRWGDLVYLKESWIAKHAKGQSGVHIKREDSDDAFEVYDEESDDVESQGSPAEGYRVLKTPVADEIRQLIISPNGTFLAVLTSHTVHICILPDSSHLTAQDTSPMKPKFYTLGPTTHVTSRSAVMSAAWHPLGVNGSALVTVTEDAVVRVWELSTTDRWSFDSPSLAIDLKKLVDGTSLDQDFSASTAATNSTFSPDSFEMEVAAASFAARGSGLWSSMTLFVAMRGGDVYALCPLLPQRWAPPATLIPSLSVSIVAKVAAIEDDPEVSPQAKLLAQQQLDWMSEIDNQEPKVVPGSFGEPPVEIYHRPSRPGVIPKLQGPFTIDLDVDSDAQDDLDIELTDIYVIGQKVPADELMMGEDEELELDDDEHEGLSLSVVCLLSTSGQLRICLDLEGVEAKWLPPRNKSKLSRLTSLDEPPSLLAFQTLDVLRPMEVMEDCWPVFSEDVTSRYSFFVTHNSGLTYISLTPWIFRLESELNAESEAGSDFRINLLVKGQNSIRERVYTQPPPGVSLAACTVLRDPDLGYFVLTATPSEAVAIIFDTPEDDFTPLREVTPAKEPAPEVAEPLVMFTPRPVFQPSSVFDQPSELPDLLQKLRTSRLQVVAHQEIRLSPTTLKLFSNAHYILSKETGLLNEAVSELFRKCDKLQVDLKEQIEKANLMKMKIEKITGDDVEEGEPVSDDVRLKRSLEERKRKQEELSQRFERLRKQLSRATTRELSDKERGYMDEIRVMAASVLGPETDETAPSSKGKPAWKRIEEVKSLKEDLVRQAEQLQKQKDRSVGDAEGNTAPSVPNLKIPSEIRKAKVSQVMTLLERETNLVDAIKSRLERLSVG
ncbi:Nucleoporin NUP82 [Pleurostoma richardsiae]|uniref:Nucleoporin NUP82 n=1 Tax=Pleurostoma richardsiae TaxID=41990 RepID=A0AA38S2K7_9PEZI|nr:Nucleoporin NUP82 [Pleurostoma richardsiae]